MSKNVVITGASSGIGEALAEQFAAKGYSLGLAARSVDKLQALAQRLTQQYSIRVEVASLDVNDDASIPAVLNDLVARLGSMDILVANAGVAGSRRSGRDDLSVDKAIFQTNLIGAIATLDAATKIFLAQGFGHLVGMSSFSAFAPIPKNAAYSASKAALTNYMNAMRLELLTSHIDVTVIHPGFINTNLAPKMDKYPFVVTADVAAKQMVRAIESKQANVIVPALPWKIVKGLFQVMPDSLMSSLMKKFVK
ncbi:MAG: SDR family NAD(P)-dependent oxidoreductase [Candidatus Saccharibacteria bacterium]|nr:SDR family NAD(P)-dependent oxidoreductase [Moraxellaceae bacterium]